MCLPVAVAARRTRFIPSLLKRLQTSKRLMLQSSIASRATMLLVDKEMDIRLVDKTSVVCKKCRMIIPKPLQRRAVLWFHHYLQHPGHTHLEKTLQAKMYWKGMRTTIRSITRPCKTCQVNKKRKFKYGHLLPKTITTTPWRMLCVDLVGPYNFKGKDGSAIDFMALTMMDPASSWFKIMELPLSDD
jgi:hypothetical protein